MAHMVGTSGQILITFCLIVSVLASYMSWTMFSTEIMFQASKTKVFPQLLSKENENKTPISSLWFTNIVIQIILLVVFFTGKGYSVLIQLSTAMILVPYFLVGGYLIKIAFKEQAAWYIKLTGIMATLYGIWLVYAAGLNYLLLSVILYLPGMVLFFYQRKHSKGYLYLSRVEKWLTLGLSLLFFAALYLLFQS